MNLIEQIEKIRKDRKFNKKTFAYHLGYSPQYYYNLTNGCVVTSDVSLQRILKNAQRL